MGEMSEKRLRAYMPMSDLEGKRDFSFQDIRGYQILNTTGHRVGTVKDVFVDPNTLEPCFAFLDYQKFMNFNVKSLLVPWEELNIGSDYVQTRWTEEHLTPETQAEQDQNLAAHGDTRGTGASMSNTSIPGIQTSPEMSPDRDITPDSEPVARYDTGEGDEETVTSATGA
jgi:sporulation protein YlmC with PRC-barrel domain